MEDALWKMERAKRAHCDGKVQPAEEGVKKFKNTTGVQGDGMTH